MVVVIGPKSETIFHHHLPRRREIFPVFHREISAAVVVADLCPVHRPISTDHRPGIRDLTLRGQIDVAGVVSVADFGKCVNQG